MTAAIAIALAALAAAGCSLLFSFGASTSDGGPGTGARRAPRFIDQTTFVEPGQEVTVPLRAWDVDTPAEELEYALVSPGPVDSATISPDGRAVVIQTRESGSVELSVTDSPGSEPADIGRVEVVVIDPGDYAHWFEGEGLWSDPARWGERGVPANGSAVLVRPGAVATLDVGTRGLSTITIANGALLRMDDPVRLEANNLFVGGTIEGTYADSHIGVGVGQSGTLAGTLPSAELSGALQIVNPTVVNGDLSILAAPLDVAGGALFVGGSCTTDFPGRVLQTGQDILIAGPLRWHTTNPLLTGGQLVLGGPVTFESDTHTASDAHTTIFESAVGQPLVVSRLSTYQAVQVASPALELGGDGADAPEQSVWNVDTLSIAAGAALRSTSVPVRAREVHLGPGSAISLPLLSLAGAGDVGADARFEVAVVELQDSGEVPDLPYGDLVLAQSVAYVVSGPRTVAGTLSADPSAGYDAVLQIDSQIDVGALSLDGPTLLMLVPDARVRITGPAGSRLRLSSGTSLVDGTVVIERSTVVLESPDAVYGQLNHAWQLGEGAVLQSTSDASITIGHVSVPAGAAAVLRAGAGMSIGQVDLAGALCVEGAVQAGALVVDGGALSCAQDATLLCAGAPCAAPCTAVAACPTR